MRGVLQRVKEASVTIDGEVTASINRGILLLAGLAEGDGIQEMDLLIRKTVNMRMFEDNQGMFDQSAKDLDLEILVVSQFTLFGDTRKGRRPSFLRAMGVDQARDQFECFMERFKTQYPKVVSGTFQAMMDVQLINDGPVTLFVDSDRNFY